MQYGLGHLSVVPIRESADSSSPMTSQVLYGDHFKIKEERKRFSRIRMIFDGMEGWIDNNQITKISEEVFQSITQLKKPVYNQDFLCHVTTKENELLPVVLGSRMDICPFLDHQYEDVSSPADGHQPNLVNTALMYLNSPFLEGGRTPFGIDSTGFTQMVYRISGKSLRRTINEQSIQGEPLSFIEESQPGDLAFFDDSEGTIDHVGIILKDNYIIHASGQVRIDRLDHTGIFNTQKRMYTHNLRVIKKMT